MRIAYIAVLACVGAFGSTASATDYLSPNFALQSDKVHAPTEDFSTSYTTLRDRLRKDVNDQTAYRELEEVATGNTTDAGLAQLMLGYTDLRREHTQKAIDRFDAIMNLSIPATPEVVADATLRSAMCNIKMKAYNTAKGKFIKLAGQTIPCNQTVALESALRLGFVFQNLREIDNALGVWDEIAAESPDPDGQAYALLQKSGFLWEIGNGMHKKNLTPEESKEYFVRSKEVAKHILDTYPSVEELTRATASLLYLEQDYFLQNYEVVPQLVETHAAKFPNQKIQLLASYGWKMMSEFKMGKLSDCVATCELLESKGFKNSDTYNIFPVMTYCKLYKYYSLKDKDVMKAEKALDEAQQLEPEAGKFKAYLNQVDKDYEKFVKPKGSAVE